MKYIILAISLFLSACYPARYVPYPMYYGDMTSDLHQKWAAEDARKDHEEIMRQQMDWYNLGQRGK